MKRHQQALIELIRKVVGEPVMGAEIGVYRGELSVVLHEAFPDCGLLLVDTWCEWGKSDSYRKTHKRTGDLTQEQWEEIHEEARKRIWAAGGEFQLFHGTSKEAAGWVRRSLDFVFIDANHSYESVGQDIELWSPLVRPGGLLSGHDYGGAYKGVKRAVDEAFGSENILLPGNRSLVWGYVVGDGNDSKS